MRLPFGASTAPQLILRLESFTLEAVTKDTFPGTGQNITLVVKSVAHDNLKGMWQYKSRNVTNFFNYPLLLSLEFLNQAVI